MLIAASTPFLIHSLAKFFDMPKSVKAPLPQQASLKEMWGKRTIVTKTEEEDEKQDHDDAMNIEPGNNSKGMAVKFQNQFISIRFSGEL